MTVSGNGNGQDRAARLAAKLKAMAEHWNANPEEAANAAARLQELKLRYDLEEVMLAIEKDEPEEYDPIHDRVILRSQRVPRWKVELGAAIADINGCKCYFTRGYGLHMVGADKDVNHVANMFEYLTGQVDWLCKIAKRSVGRPGRSWANSYRWGAVSTIKARLWEAHKQAKDHLRGEYAKNPHALMVVNNALTRIDNRGKRARAWIKENLRLRSSRTRSKFNPDAYNRGRHDGRIVDIPTRKQIP